MARSRRAFLQLAGSATGSALLVGCDAAAVQSSALADTSNSQASHAGTPPPAMAPGDTSSSAASGGSAASAFSSPTINSLKSYLQQHASPTFSLPPAALSVPGISWAGALTGSTAASSLPNGVVIPFASSLISKPIAQLYSASLPANPQVGGHPCLAVNRPYTCKGTAQQVGSVRCLRIRTDAPVLELSGVVPDGGQTVQTLVVDGYLVPTKILTNSLGLGGGWDVGTIRINFGTRQLRDIWLECYMYVAYAKVDASDTVVAPTDAAEPQITVIGDSYLQCQSAAFGNGGAIALELAARLGIRKVATDAVGGTGYYNSNTNIGNFNDRLPAHAQDNSTIYLVMGGLNDYGDRINGSTTVWPTLAQYDQAVLGYLQGLRARQPNALIVMTAPFCPNPTLSDSSWIANPATNTTGTGDNLYKAQLFKQSMQNIAAPWIYIDVLMGTGWLNSSGATGDVRNLQWFTGGTPAPGTSSTYKPGNTAGGGGGGFGGIASVPVVNGGRYSQAPDVLASGGSGSGLLLFSSINQATGAVSAINVLVPGSGYSSGSGLPRITLDPTFQIMQATLGTPTLQVGINPGGAYPLPAWLPEGVSDLNNIYRLLRTDATHPSTAGVSYLATRLALSIFAGVMAL
jgi:hypothetical protein